MKRNWAHWTMAAALLTAGSISLLLTGVTSLKAQEAPRVDVVSSKGFEATVDALTTALKKEVLMIVATIDHQKMLTMVGASIKGSRTIEFGKVDMGKMLLPMAPEVGLETPGKIYVWERGDGKTVISYRKVAALFATYGKKEMTEAGQMMDMITSKVVEAAAR